MFSFHQNFVLPHSVSNMENNLFTKIIFHLILQISRKKETKKKKPRNFSFIFLARHFFPVKAKKEIFFFFFSGDKKICFYDVWNKVEKRILLRFFSSLAYTWRKCPAIFSPTWFQTLIIFSPGKKYCMSSQTEKIKEETAVFFPPPGLKSETQERKQFGSDLENGWPEKK